MFVPKKGLEYLLFIIYYYYILLFFIIYLSNIYSLFDVLPKQRKFKMKTLQVQVYMQQ